ncbi:MAG TPA: hypothetical protein EYP60_00095 [bacterium (Candidatus Stahlbacteria)]|nr:hypothetical protein [Candidatus Stahlbacteria bacterium]
MEIKNIREELQKVQRNSRVIQKLLTQYERLKKDAISNAYKLEDLWLKIDKATKDLPIESTKAKIIEWLAVEKSELQKLKNEFQFHFGKQLEQTLKSKGMELRGQYPTLYTGLYKLVLTFEKGDVQIFWGPEFVKKVRLNPDEVASAIERFDKELKGRSWDPAVFFLNLRTAYKRVLTIASRSIGERVPIVDVMDELVFLMQDKKFRSDPTKRNFRGYSRAFFGYDLYRLRRSGQAKELSLIVATFDTTKYKEKVIFVPESEERGTRYAYLVIGK